MLQPAKMVAISLLDIPPEIQLQIVESTETTQVLKALSVTSRSLRSIAQSLLFEEFRIDPAKELRGSINDLLANPRICAAIRVFLLGGAHPNSKKPPHNDEEKLSLIQRLLPEMVGLRWVIIHRVHLSRTFMDAFIEVAAKIPLRVNLCWNIYPSCISSAPIKPLRIYHLCLNSASRPSLNFYRSVLRASATMLTALNVRVHGDGLMTLADIDLPLLHDVTLWITLEHELSRTSISAFIAAQKTIRKLKFRGKIRHLPPLPPNALPNLQELNAPPELINQLVPGRPLEAIEVSFSPVNRDWFGEEVARSTARIRKLQVHLNTKILDTRMMGRMVTILPSLERLRLSVFDDVNAHFARLPLLICPSGPPHNCRNPQFPQVPHAPTQ